MDTEAPNSAWSTITDQLIPLDQRVTRYKTGRYQERKARLAPAEVPQDDVPFPPIDGCSWQRVDGERLVLWMPDPMPRKPQHMLMILWDGGLVLLETPCASCTNRNVHCLRSKEDQADSPCAICQLDGRDCRFGSESIDDLVAQESSEFGHQSSELIVADEEQASQPSVDSCGSQTEGPTSVPPVHATDESDHEETRDSSLPESSLQSEGYEETPYLSYLQAKIEHAKTIEQLGQSVPSGTRRHIERLQPKLRSSNPEVRELALELILVYTRSEVSPYRAPSEDN